MTLLIMAAGIGRRFGGIKQIESVGACDEKIIDYSVYDAVKAGFDNIVFVISRDIETDFRKKFFIPLRSIAIERGFSVSYVLQETPPWRTKPLGTTSAVMSARNVIHEPFMLINADDFYGAKAFDAIANFFKGKRSVTECCMVGYRLGNTLSAHGSVSRGVISYEKGLVTEIKEQQLSACDDCDLLVSMNCFGFTHEVFSHLGITYDQFIANLGKDTERECMLSVDIGQLIRDGKIKMRLLESHDQWLGFTYRQDKDNVVARIREMTNNGLYPSPLWGLK